MPDVSALLPGRYVLAVKNLEKSAAYYRDLLGCTTDWTQDGWHQLRRGHFVVLLGECSDDVSAFETNNHSYCAYVDVLNIDALHAEWLAKGVEIHYPLGDRPWGQREFGIRTIDGHRMMFGQPVAG